MTQKLIHSLFQFNVTRDIPPVVNSAATQFGEDVALDGVREGSTKLNLMERGVNVQW
jgi:hypothetical protein